jgi:hypothetical protein
VEYRGSPQIEEFIGATTKVTDWGHGDNHAAKAPRLQRDRYFLMDA